MIARRVNIIADDYGLSPGIGHAIRELVGDSKITGTSCMTLFPDWLEQAKLLRLLQVRSRPEVGLHLTLTDFPPRSSLNGTERMPTLSTLIRKSYLGVVDQVLAHVELDAQLEQFVQGIGRLPDFIDGHQHVHFLPVVRRWLETRKDRLSHSGQLPWLRGAPRMQLAGTGVKAKVAFVSLIAAGFNRRMKAAGFPVRGPLTGFYDWGTPDKFYTVIRQMKNALPVDTVFMCHPGWIDEMLVSRDSMIAARPIEAKALNAMLDVTSTDFDQSGKTKNA